MASKRCNQCANVISTDYQICPICSGREFEESPQAPTGTTSHVVPATERVSTPLIVGAIFGVAIIVSIIIGLVQSRNSGAISFEDPGSTTQSTSNDSTSSLLTNWRPDGFVELGSDVDQYSEFGWSQSGASGASCSGQTSCALINLVTSGACTVVTADVQFTDENGNTEDASGTYQDTGAGVPFILEVDASSDTNFTQWTFQRLRCS